MWARDRRALGKTGEGMAIDFLTASGYKIIERNFRTPFGEIDAIARKDGALVFVETKTRLSESIGPPFLSITRRKERKMVQNALYYLVKKGLADRSWGIDVISVKLASPDRAESIEILKNAVEE